MKANEVRSLEVDELTEKLSAAREELFNLRFRHATGQLENTARITAVRREVARMLTIQRQGAEETK